MEKKDTLSSCSDSEIQQMQLIQDKSKESCMVYFQQLHSHLKCLSNNDLKGSRTEDGFKRAFATLFGQDLETFTGTMFLYMDQLQKQLDNEEFQEIGSMSAFKVLQTQFQMFIKSRFYLDDEYVNMTRNKFLQYTRLDIPEFCNILIQHMESVKKSIGERAQHKIEYESRVNERRIQTKKEKTDTSNALDASSVIIESNGTESKEQDTSSRSGNDAHVDDADIRPIYDEEPMAEVQMTADDNVSATGQQHTEQPEFNNEGKVDQNAEQCHDIRPLPAKLTDDKTIELSDQSLESENVCLKKTVAQCQKDFAKLEAHCINLELQMQNNVLKSGQQSQFLKEKSNEAKVKNDIDVTETINIELEHSVAKLLAENEQLHKEKEHLKQTYKDLFDSIKRTRVQTKDQNESLMAQLNKKSNENADVLAQIQKKGFAIAALKNELRKLTGNSVNTKFAKPSILGKPVGQPLKNQSVVRQPTAFKSERPRISKPRFASQVDVNNDLSKPVTTHYLPKRRESAPAKPHHMIAPSSSRFSTGKTFATAQQRLKVNPQMVQMQISPNQCESEQALNGFKGIIDPDDHKMTFEHSSSSLDHQCQMVSAENNTSGPAPFLNVQRCLIATDQASVFMEMMSVHISSGLVLHQMTSDHNRSELGIQDHSNEQTSPKLVPKFVPLAFKTATSRQKLELLFHLHIAMLRTTEHLSYSRLELVLPRHAMFLAPEKGIVFQDNAKDEHDCQRHKIAMAKTIKPMTKASKSRSQSNEEQLTTNNEGKDQEHSSLNDKSNLTDLMKECHQ
ncbi:hypothetical protein Tco_0416907 [Tanacetum coccineum]